MELLARDGRGVFRVNLTGLVIAALAVLPSDRLAMADRLFNRGEYAAAKVEYSALRGEKSIAADELLYRLAECERALGARTAARSLYGEILERHPSSPRADRSRLMKALVGDEAGRREELKSLDSDRVEPPIRAAALYHLGVLTGDAECLARSLKLEPHGRYSTYANFHLAEIRSRSGDPKVRRRAVDSLLEIAFGRKDDKLAEEAIYLAAVHCYNEKRYGEASSLLNRGLKMYPGGKHSEASRRLAAWSDYLSGRYSDAIRICDGSDADDFLYLKAAAVFAQGDRARAKELFLEYLEKHPSGAYRANAELPLALIGYIEAEKSGDMPKMVECARRAQELSGSGGDGLRLGWAYEKSGDLQTARDEYLKVARKHPDTEVSAEALYRKAMLDIREGRWSPADLALSEALSGGRLDARFKATALYWRGIAAVRLDHRSEGAALMKDALAAGLPLDEQREARLLLADFDYEKGRVKEACAEYAQLVLEGACDRMSAAKIHSVGRLLAGSEAAAVCAKALVANGSAQWRQAGYCLLGGELSKAHSYAAAIDAYRKAMAEKAETEDLAAASVELGALESRAGEYEKAEETLKRAVGLNRADPSRRALAYLWLAKNAMAKKDFASARAYATVVESLFGGEKESSEAREILAKIPEGEK